MTSETALGVLLSSIKLSQELKSEFEKSSSQTKKPKGDGILSAHTKVGHLQKVMETLGACLCPTLRRCQKGVKSTGHARKGYSRRHPSSRKRSL
ncbi:hypothetical protein ACJ73_02245 [Blastomyces percursus]|uniref:Uncharacterized protein n=1 Tax=Blastomyces percursus TaxID=1658174 RepID=A0A1J9QE49_9EURO|nr:hypothetical protein ACJ73_02245 [Blastomyces percursus]